MLPLGKTGQKNVIVGENGQNLQGISLLFFITVCESAIISIKIKNILAIR